MPPVRTKKGDAPSTVRKEVKFVAKDADEQVASGIVMVPDKADLQRDFAREDTIRAFADQFDTFEEAGEAGGGIMHAVFPEEWMTLERNEVLDEAETIGSTEAPAGAWVQDWSIENDEHWGLIEDGIFEGYSIGAIDVRWDGPYEQDDDPVDDVDTPEEIGDDPIWELIDGIVREVSTVDIPAVPDAQILETKADAEKRLGDYLGDQSGFIEEAQERGHSEEAAQRMWDVLNDAADVDGAGEPGRKGRLSRAVTAFVKALPGSDDDSRSEAPDSDAIGRADEGEDEDEDDEPDDEDDPEGDTSENTTDMSNDDTPDDGGPDPLELAEQNAEQITDLTQAVEDLTESLTGPEPKTAEIEIEGETYEVREEAAKAALGVDENQSVADAIEALNEKASRVDEVESRLDTIVQQSGAGSQQVDSAAEGGDDENDGGLEGLGKALS